MSDTQRAQHYNSLADYFIAHGVAYDPRVTRQYENDRRIERFFRTKYRDQAKSVGVYQAARNMRKQGIPIDIARAILL